MTLAEGMRDRGVNCEIVELPMYLMMLHTQKHRDLHLHLQRDLVVCFIPTLSTAVVSRRSWCFKQF